jgi:hypothetical protein
MKFNKDNNVMFEQQSRLLTRSRSHALTFLTLSRFSLSYCSHFLLTCSHLSRSDKFTGCWQPTTMKEKLEN